MSKKSKIRAKLPKEMIIFDNPDKTFHEKWYSSRSPLDIPHPFRAVLLSVPNCGKTNTMMNIILHAADGKEPFMRIILIHPDVEFTKEYDRLEDINLIKLNTIPPPDSPYFDGKLKTLVVFDDYEFKHELNKETKHNLDRLLAYVSTHKNVSIIIAMQDPYNVFPSARRMCNFWIMWKIDPMSVMDIMNKLGFDSKTTKELFGLLKTQHDSLWIDKTKDSPHPLRLNGFTDIEIEKED